MVTAFLIFSISIQAKKLGVIFSVKVNSKGVTVASMEINISSRKSIVLLKNVSWLYVAGGSFNY